MLKRVLKKYSRQPFNKPFLISTVLTVVFCEVFEMFNEASLQIFMKEIDTSTNMNSKEAVSRLTPL